MHRKNLAAPVLLLLVGSLPAMAQYTTTPSPQGSAAPPAPTSTPGLARLDNLTVTPKNGQTQEQMWSDRYECHGWAKAQSSFDPTLPAPSGLTPDEITSRREQYRRALSACLEGKGYAVQFGRTATPATTPVTAPRAVPVPAGRVVSPTPELKYRPFEGHIDGGYTATTGTTDRYLDGGGNIGFGFAWFPTSLLPVGLRVDGSYSTFDGRGAFRDLYGPDTLSAHQNVYGGDADLQLDLAHGPNSKFYLLGGAGWYREQTRLRQISFETGTFCDFFGCQQGAFAVRTVDRITSPWRSSWNAGLGWEVATADDGASFFVEARYLQIAPRASKMQFVPIRIGLRF
jgi:hypothetical protein